MQVSIEGSIGAGKTQNLMRLQKEMRLPVFLEDVDNWTMLSKFYESNERWGFAFNTEVLLSMAKWKHNSFDSLYERSPLSCRHVFVELQRQYKTMTDEECNLFDKLYEQYAWQQDAIIFLDTDPIVCYERMKKRDRPCERGVELSYMQDVHQKHIEMLEYVRLNKPLVKVFVVDGNRSEEQVCEDVSKILRDLLYHP